MQSKEILESRFSWEAIAGQAAAIANLRRVAAELEAKPQMPASPMQEGLRGQVRFRTGMESGWRADDGRDLRLLIFP